MNITEFGAAVRKARIDAKVTMQAMAEDLGVSSAFLSSMEVGRKKISPEWVKKIDGYFRKKKVKTPDLQKLANVSNKEISLEGMNPQQAMMLAGFARTNMTREQLECFTSLLKRVEKDK